MATITKLSEARNLKNIQNQTITINADIDLGTETITLGSGCRLEFSENGRFRNGTLIGTVTNEYLDITDFGASTTSNSGNNAALTNAMNLCDNVFIPEGTFQVTGSVNITRSGIRLFGNGYHLSVIQSIYYNTSDTKTVDRERDKRLFNLVTVNSGIENISIENLALQSKGSKKKANYLIKVHEGTKNVHVKGCLLDNATGGVIVYLECEWINIIGCRFRNMVFLPGGSGGEQNEDKTRTLEGGAGGYGVVFQQNKEKPGIKHGVISSCVFESTVIRHAVYIQKSSDVLISDNVIYGTTAMNDNVGGENLVNILNTKGLTNDQLGNMEVNKHMTHFDYAFEYKGSHNVRITNNYLKGGIGFLNGMADANNIGGTMFLIKDNTAVEFDNNLGKADCPNGVKGDRNWICDIAIEGGAIIINSDNLSDQQ
ncbi:MAG: hypothetical protein IJ467_04830 [Bacteroidaceae bacterium]|nr:hypothetical protein [Bacteroidaceae bacterium]